MHIKKLLQNWLFHTLIIWILLNIYYSLSYLYQMNIWGPMTVNSDGSPVTVLQMLSMHNLQHPDYLFLLPFVLLVELNYWLIFKKYSIIYFIIGVLFCGAFASFFIGFVNSLKSAQPKFPVNYLEPALAFAAYALAYSLIREFFHLRLFNVKMRLLRTENDLHQLKQQLNPHFLFNTMNYLYGTALQENATRTAEGIDLVSGMMRYTVTGMQETFVPLNDELEFIKNYLYLQQVRMPVSDDHTIETDIKTDDQPYQIAPMLLIPYIENAFKHGISTEQDSRIKVIINVENGELKMQVINTVIPDKKEVKGTNSGLALTNKRLAILYPDQHQLEINRKDHIYEVKLSLQLIKTRKVRPLKKLFMLVCVMLPLMSQAQSPKPDSAFTISIKTQSTPANAKAYLLYQFEGKKYMDSSAMENHTFSFRGNVGQPTRATLVFDTSRGGLRTILKKRVSTADALPFYIHPGQIVAATDRHIADASFDVSAINKDYAIINRRLKLIHKQEAITSEQLVAERDTAKLKALEAAYARLQAMENPVYIDFIKSHPNSYVSLIALQEYKYYLDGKDDYSPSVEHHLELKTYYGQLSHPVRATALGKQLGKDIDADLVLKPGAIAPEFAQPDVSGKMVRLSDFKGKYVLLDIWASWCGPCRKNNPELVKIYHDFKSRNFTILGISLDDVEGKNSWMKAIKDDHLEWTQVSDLKHWDNLVTKLYSIKAIPESILIGPDGKIVARQIYGNDLREKLNQLLPPTK